MSFFHGSIIFREASTSTSNSISPHLQQPVLAHSPLASNRENPLWLTYVCLYVCTHLSIGQQSVHPLQEPRLQHVGLIKDEHNLLITTASSAQHKTEVIIKIRGCVLAMDLRMTRQQSSLPLNAHTILLLVPPSSPSFPSQPALPSATDVLVV